MVVMIEPYCRIPNDALLTERDVGLRPVIDDPIRSWFVAPHVQEPSNEIRLPVLAMLIEPMLVIRLLLARLTMEPPLITRPPSVSVLLPTEKFRVLPGFVRVTTPVPNAP